MSAYSTLKRFSSLSRRTGDEGPADHLLAEKLRAEGPHTEHMGDRVRVPAFCQHRDRDHAADLLAEPSLLPTVFITSRSSS